MSLKDSVSISWYFFSPQKRWFDIVISVIVLTFFLPVFLFIAVTILLTSGLPIFYVQERAGQHKKIFRLIKFRTMYVDAHQDQKKFQKKNQSPFPTFKIYDDPRFVGIGKLLSRTGLDELPQVINILKGEMSFVGPRPLPNHEAELLDSSLDFRYSVKPGILSAWAISKEKNDSLETWKSKELQTLKHQSFFEDIQLIGQAMVIAGEFLIKRYLHSTKTSS